MDKKLLIIFLMLFCFGFANGNTITSTGTGGDWSLGSSWVGGNVPLIGDDVIIATGATVTISTNVVAKSLTINGTLFISGDHTVATGAGNTLTVIINGLLDFVGQSSVYFPDGTVLDINAPGKIDDSKGGGCTNNVAVYIGSVKFAVCAGAGNAEFTFTQLNAGGGTLQPNPSSNAPVCEGGSLTFTAAKDGADGSGLTWQWSITNPLGVIATYGAVTNVVLSNVLAGNYVATLTYSTTYGSTPYSNAKTISAVVNPRQAKPTISTSGATSFCAGGTVTLTSSAASGNTWSTGATTQSIVVSTSGSYFVRATNAFACVSVDSDPIAVTVNPKPAAPTIAAGGATTFCAGGSVTLTSSAGSGYLWSTGATTPSITVAASGSYTVQITDVNGCQSLPSSATSVTVNPKPAAPTIAAGGATTFCAGGSVTLTSSAGSGYLWSTGATTPSITVASSGSYTVQITDVNGCQSLPSSATSVTVNPKPAAPTIAAGGATTFCAGGSVTLTSSAGSGYLWSTGATTPSITVAASGSYTVQITDVNGCQSLPSSATSVTVNPKPAAPTIAAGGATTFCAGGSVTLTSSAGSGYLWSTGATTPSITVAASGSYTVQITDVNGCQSLPSSATSVTVNPKPAAPTIAAGGATTFCAGGSVTLTSSAGSGYLWSTGATTPSITVAASGSYTVQITDVNGCQSLPSSATSVTVNPKPAAPTIAPGGPTTFCAGGSVTLTSSAGSGYLWSTGATTPSITVATSGSYTVQITDVNGCQSLPSSATSVTVNPKPGTPTIAPDGPTTFCEGGSVTLTSSAGSGYLWSTGATTPSITVTTSGSYTVQITDVNGCQSLPSSATPVTVNPKPAAPTITPNGSTTFCAGDSVTLTSSAGSGYLWSTGATTASIVVTTSGNYTVQITNATGCQSPSSAITAVTVKSLLNVPNVFSVIQPTCVVGTGSIVLNNLPATTLAIPTWTIDQTGPSTRSYVGGSSGDPTTYSISNLAPGFYNFTVTFGDYCPVTINNVEVKNPEVNIWRGTTLGWSKGTAPSSSGTESIEFAADYQSAGDLAGCSCKVDAGKIVTINSGNTLYVENAIAVESAAGSKLIFENNASLVQLNNVINTGEIIYKRDTAPVRRYDFTFWSSPVSRIPAFQLYDLSPGTLGDKYYKFSPASGWVIIYGGAAEMEKGVGYIIRAPQYFDITTTAVYNATFTGVPNNGTITVPLPVAEKSNLLGNPYPSAIYADQFILDNQANLYGTLYFWTHNSPPSNLVAGDATYNYTTSDYAAYNLTGSVDVGHISGSGASTPGNMQTPLGYIASGQAFFVKSRTNASAVFTNSMRVRGSNAQFFKTANSNKTNIEAHKLWLNLSNTQGAFKQILVGYIEGATNSWDNNYDGLTLNGNAFVDFYSVNENLKLVVQGRALPFVETDVVPLGYKSTIAGDFTISIDHAMGDLSTHAIYLEDKTTNIIYDLRAGNYTFTTAIGTFDNRFVLRYANKTLATNDFKDADQNVLVSVKDKVIKVVSTKENINNISIFDTTGKLLYTKTGVGATELLITTLQSENQLLLIKGTLENEGLFTAKIIF